MVVLTAYNEQVQKWVGKPSKTMKKERLQTFINNFKGIFEQVFTDAKKSVLDVILFLSSKTGVCTVKGETLANKSNVKIRTVRNAVKSLKETDQFVIGQTANKRCGAYIFVDKSHENFPKIMKDLFNIDITNALPDALPNAQQDAQQDAHLEKPQNVDITAVEEEKQEPISFNSFSSSNDSKDLKDLKPKQENPVNLFGRICDLLNVVKSNSLVVKLMRLSEKAKKDIMNFTDEHFIYALQEAINNNAKDLEAYTASIVYNTNKKDSMKKNVATKGYEFKWFKEGKHKQHEDVNKAENCEEFEETRKELLKRLGYAVD